MSDRLRSISRRDLFKFTAGLAAGLALEAALGSGERVEVQPMPGRMFFDPYCGLNVASDGRLIISGRDGN